MTGSSGHLGEGLVRVQGAVGAKAYHAVNTGPYTVR